MKIGQRINLLKKISKRLSENSFSDGDLILRQFGLPWTNQWQGGGQAYDYYLEMIDQAKNQDLIELHEYLFPGDELPGIQIEQKKGNWENGTLRIFLSHSSKNKLFATQIKQQLKDYGIECFVAHEDIEPTKEWLKEIKLALCTCHVLIAFLCKDFSSSKYCDQEVGFALHRDILVIPVKIESVDPYGFMAPFQAITVSSDKNPSDIAEEIYKLIYSHPTTNVIAQKAQLVALEILVDSFLQSSDWGTSSSLLKKLEGYPNMPQELIQAIAENWQKNDQITGCNGIPKRIEKLFKKHNYSTQVQNIPE